MSLDVQSDMSIIGEIRILGTRTSRVGLIRASFILIAHIIKKNIDAGIKYLGWKHHGVPGAPDSHSLYLTGI